MSELTVDFIITLDGYGAGKGWPSYWGLEGPEYLAWLAEDNQDELVYLMGKNTYELMAPWAGQSDAPESVALDNARKVVFSSSLKEPLSWSNSELVSDDAAAFVKDLKANESRPLSTLGSVSLSRSLIAAGLVDRFRVVVFPVITGQDRPRTHLRRLPRRLPQTRRKPHVRRRNPVARLHPHRDRRATRDSRLIGHGIGEGRAHATKTSSGPRRLPCPFAAQRSDRAGYMGLACCATRA